MKVTHKIITKIVLPDAPQTTVNQNYTIHMYQPIVIISQEMSLKQDELLRDKGREDIVEFRLGIWGISVNLKEIWRRIRRWMVNK